MNVEKASEYQLIVELSGGSSISGEQLAQPVDHDRQRLSESCALVQSEVGQDERTVRAFVELLFVRDDDARMALCKAGFDLDGGATMDEVLIGRVGTHPC